MKKTPFLVLLAFLVVCVPVAGYFLINTPKRFSPQNELVGKKLTSGFSSSDVQKVRIAAGKNEVVLIKKDGKWIVPSRADNPIDSEKEIERLVASILALQVGLEIPAEPKHYALMGLLSPDENDLIEKQKEAEKAKGEENPSDPSGLLVTLYGAGDSVLSNIVFGEDFGGDPGQPRRGIVLRDLAGNEGAWKVVGSINRRTGELGGSDLRRGPIAEPKSWLAYNFIEVEKIKSITLSAPSDKEFKGWTATRDTEDGGFVVSDLEEDEEMDTAAASFKTLFSTLQFEDILDPAEAEKWKDPSKTRQAVIATFEGFTYTFDLTPAKEEDESEEDDTPRPPAGNFIGSVKVEASFPETREKVEGETEEKAKAEEQAFAVRLENLKTKLEREKAFEGRTYEFAQWSINTLNKPRTDLVKEKAPDSPDGENDKPGASIPGSRPTAVTPPVRIPPAPPQEP